MAAAVVNNPNPTIYTVVTTAAPATGITGDVYDIIKDIKVIYHQQICYDDYHDCIRTQSILIH